MLDRVLEYGRKLFKAENAVTFDIVLLDDVCYFCFGHLLAQLLHGVVNVFIGNLPGVVGVELLEDNVQLLISHELPDVYRCRQELTVVDLLIAIVVNLANNLI